jgi:hypothetical protein
MYGLRVRHVEEDCEILVRIDWMTSLSVIYPPLVKGVVTRVEYCSTGVEETMDPAKIPWKLDPGCCLRLTSSHAGRTCCPKVRFLSLLSP